MVKFRIKSRNNIGDVFEEIGEFKTKSEAIQSVITRGLIPLEVKKNINFDASNVIITKSVSKQKTADFLEMLSDTIESGLSLTSGTEEAIEFEKTGYMSVVVKGIDTDIRKGIPLSDALESYPTVFNESDINIIRAGEGTGKTAEVLAKIADNHRKSGDFTKALIGSLIYPSVILIMTVIVVWVLMVFMIPVISEMYTQIDGELPYITVLVVSLSTKFSENFILITLVIVALIVATIYALRIQTVRLKVDYYLTKLFFVGKLIKTYETYKMCYVLASLIEGGVATNKALDIASRVVKNKFISTEVNMVKRDVEVNGLSLSDAFSKTQHALPVFVQNISSGERTGEIADKLFKLSKRLEKSLNKSLNTIKSVVSPVLIAIMSVFVGVLMFAVMSPMYSIMDYI